LRTFPLQKYPLGAAIPTKKSPGCALTWLLSQDAVKNLVEGVGTGSPKTMQFRLYMAGWERYYALKRAQVKSRTAFMAMQFGDAELNRVVDDCFKPAVEATGFELRQLTDGQPAGLIDDQLRVRLQTARFVIADLTHGNNGAYWEAGFAEGLGRPVIYTCRKREWDQRDQPSEHKVHFDTNHHLTVIWEPENLQDAAMHLTATIRATLPAEAKMTD
jgi:nucleoside 2-deoxyribosyltransferase